MVTRAGRWAGVAAYLRQEVVARRRAASRDAVSIPTQGAPSKAPQWYGESSRPRGYLWGTGPAVAVCRTARLCCVNLPASTFRAVMQHLRRVVVSFTNVRDMLAVLLCGDGRAYDRLRVPSHHRSAARAVRANDVRREISAESRFSGKCRRRYARFGADVVRRFAAGHRRF